MSGTALKSALPVHEIRWRIYWRHDAKSAWREFGSEGSEHNGKGATLAARRNHPDKEFELRRVITTTLTDVVDV